MPKTTYQWGQAEGFYWVKYRDGVPKIAEWSDDAWWFVGVDESIKDGRGIFVLSERLEPPKEASIAALKAMLPVAARNAICEEIRGIMETYREQEKSRYGLGTPGGLEHMGDVWRLLRKWDQMLEPPKESK